MLIDNEMPPFAPLDFPRGALGRSDDGVGAAAFRPQGVVGDI